MPISKIIAELEEIKSHLGDIDVALQSDEPKQPENLIVNTSDFFIVPGKIRRRLAGEF
mgnify:CR=1 FL=1